MKILKKSSIIFEKKNDHMVRAKPKMVAMDGLKKLTLNSSIKKHDFYVIQIGKHSMVILGRKLRKP